MTTWTQRAKTHFSQTGANGTAETAERGIDFLQTGISGTAETVKRGVSAVLAVPIGAIREKRDFSKSAEPTPTEGQDLPQADIGTIRPPGMTDRFLAASQALDRQIADEDLQQREGMARVATAEVLSLFTRSKPTPTDPHRFDSAPIPAPRPAPAAKPKPDDWFHVDAPWRPLAKAYYAHHVNCKACQSSGQGRGDKCSTGDALWSVYLAHTEGATK